MDLIYDWVKNLVFFYVMFTAVLHLLPKNSYHKYIKFFGGLLLVVMLLTPVLDLIFDPNYLLEQIGFEKFWTQVGGQ